MYETCSKMATETEIELFLKDFKFKLDFWGLLFQNRLNKKNFQTLTDLELNVEDVKKELRALGVANYSEGPLPDKLYNGAPMWVFGKMVSKREIYIKITMGQPNDKVICISFHFPEHAMTYPYKN